MPAGLVEIQLKHRCPGTPRPVLFAVKLCCAKFCVSRAASCAASTHGNYAALNEGRREHAHPKQTRPKIYPNPALAQPEQAASKTRAEAERTYISQAVLASYGTRPGVTPA